MASKDQTVYDTLAAALREVDEDLTKLDAAGLKGKHLTDDLGLDSLDLVKLILVLEERFDRKIPDEDFDALGLFEVDKLAKYLARKPR